MPFIDTKMLIQLSSMLNFIVNPETPKEPIVNVFNFDGQCMGVPRAVGDNGFRKVERRKGLDGSDSFRVGKADNW